MRESREQQTPRDQALHSATVYVAACERDESSYSPLQSVMYIELPLGSIVSSSDQPRGQYGSTACTHQ